MRRLRSVRVSSWCPLPLDYLSCTEALGDAAPAVSKVPDARGPPRLAQSNPKYRPRRILVSSSNESQEGVRVMTRRARGWLYAAIFFVVSGVLVALPSAANAGIALNGLD